MFSVGKAGALKIISNNVKFTNLNFPKIMTEKGFPEDESDGVKNYFYRSDGYKLWNIFSRYVSSMVYKAYIYDAADISDNQLQQFASSVANKYQGNVPGFPGKMLTRADLVKVITSVILHQVLHIRYDLVN